MLGAELDLAIGHVNRCVWCRINPPTFFEFKRMGRHLYMDAQSNAAAAAASAEANKDANMTTLSKVLLACAKAITLGEDAIPGLEALADLLGQPAIAVGLGVAAQAGSIVQSTLTAIQAKAAANA